MGYDLFITRREEWSDPEDDNNILMDEWLEYVKNDPELRLTNGYQIKIPNVDDRWMDAPGFAEWLLHPDAKNEYIPWFDYSGGNINTKNPDLPTIEKMLSIAKKLDAKVLGQDGELYDESFILNEIKAQEAKKKVSKRPWWKFW